MDRTNVRLGWWERRTLKRRRELLATLIDRLAPLRPRRVLDVGGGTGAFVARLFPQLGAQRCVLDVRARRLRSGRHRRPDLAYVRGRGERLPFPSGSFDLILAVMSWHHLTDPFAFLEEARRVVRDGAPLAIYEADPSTANGRRLAGLERWAPGGGRSFCPPEALRHRSESAGWAVREIVRWPDRYLLLAA